jgi:hypothetical protein
MLVSGYSATLPGAEVVTQARSEERTFLSQEFPLAGEVWLSPLQQVNPPKGRRVYDHQVNGEESDQLLITCIC